MAVFVGIIFVIFLVFLILKRNVDFFHPAILFTIIILGTYFLACLRLSDLQTEYPLWFTMLIFGMVSVFWLGCKAGQVLPVSEGNGILFGVHHEAGCPAIVAGNYHFLSDNDKNPRGTPGNQRDQQGGLLRIRLGVNRLTAIHVVGIIII